MSSWSRSVGLRMINRGGRLHTLFRAELMKMFIYIFVLNDSMNGPIVLLAGVV